jgi:hypothetical protein
VKTIITVNDDPQGDEAPVAIFYEGGMAEEEPTEAQIVATQAYEAIVEKIG